MLCGSENPDQLILRVRNCERFGLAEENDGSLSHPTGPFPISELQTPSIDVSELNNIAYRRVLRLGNGVRVGRAVSDDALK